MRIGLVGFPLKRSLSRYLYRALYHTTGFKLSFYEFETQHPFDAINEMIEKGFSGFFVTIPYKTLLVDKTLADETVRKTTNLNCVSIKENTLLSTNTDYKALEFLLAIKGVDISGKEAVVIGNGSAALTSASLLVEKGIKKIKILSRSTEKNKRFLDLYGDCFSFSLLSEINSIVSDILINATPLGMYYDFPQIKINSSFIIDFAYLPTETELIKKAKVLKANFIDGKEILTLQGIFGLKHIFGVDLLDSYHKIYQRFLQVIKEDL